MKKRIALLVLLVTGLTALIAAPAQAQGTLQSPAELQTAADFMDTQLFGPHNSPITGQMVIDNSEWYGIDPLPQLVVLAAETSLGDPRLGGALALHNNFGCMRYSGPNTRWGELSSGPVWVKGLKWYDFATPELGMRSWGRYLKLGAKGAYLSMLNGDHPDWASFAAIYYGRFVPGYQSYVARLQGLEARLRTRAADYGVNL
jgi:hypothetical protein